MNKSILQVVKEIKGITLIELLAVISIVGILAAVAVPSYTGYMQRTRRADAKTALEQLRAAQEIWRAERGRYANNGDDGGDALLALQNTCGAPANTVGYYNISITAASRTTFTAQADSFGSQASDGDLFIDHRGTKTPADKWAK